MKINGNSIRGIFKLLFGNEGGIYEANDIVYYERNGESYLMKIKPIVGDTIDTRQFTSSTFEYDKYLVCPYETTTINGSTNDDNKLITKQELYQYLQANYIPRKSIIVSDIGPARMTLEGVYQIIGDSNGDVEGGPVGVKVNSNENKYVRVSRISDNKIMTELMLDTKLYYRIAIFTNNQFTSVEVDWTSVDNTSAQGMLTLYSNYFSILESKISYIKNKVDSNPYNFSTFTYDATNLNLEDNKLYLIIYNYSNNAYSYFITKSQGDATFPGLTLIGGVLKSTSGISFNYCTCT